MKDLLLLAASGLAREVASARQDEHHIVGVLDDDATLRGRRTAGIEVLGGIELAVESDAELLVCAGSGAARRRVVTRLSALGVGQERYARLVDDSARIPANCSIGAGSIVLAGVVLTADVRVGRHVVAMPHVTLTHDDVIEDYVTLTAGVSLGGSVTVEEAAYLGMNASVRQAIRIGAGAVVGMGAAVVIDVPAGESWVGVPAHPLRTKLAAGSR